VSETKPDRDERVRLPLNTETSLRALLKVDPDAEPVPKPDENESKQA